MRATVLLSGGKDSVLATHIAADHGWHVVSAIVVRPEDPESMLYHVPNLNVAELQAQRMGLDLLTVDAPGIEGEEQEWTVLEGAFAETRSRHRVETLLTGALASEYQRVRVEEAAHRAGIKSHHPLWHKAGGDVLDLALTMQMDVRFSRVAAMGLDASWLGERLTSARANRLRTMRFHAAGEGGEFETLVLDAPLFERPIVVRRSEVRWERDRGDWIVHEAT